MRLWNYIKSLNETFLVAIVAIVVIPFGVWFYTHLSNKSEFKCPSEYETAEKYTEDLAKWIRKSTDANPGITGDELLALRDKKLGNHRCRPSPWGNELDGASDSQRTASSSVEFNETSGVFNVSPRDKIIKFGDKSYGPYITKQDLYTGVRSVYYPLLGQKTVEADEEVILNFYIQGVWADEVFTARDFANQFVNGSENDGDYILDHFEAPDPVTKEPAFYIVSYAIYPDLEYGYVFLSKITSIKNDVYSVLLSKKFVGTEMDLKNKMTEWLEKEGDYYQTVVADIKPDNSWIELSDNFPIFN